MLPTHRLPTHPGEMLLHEFLKPMKLTQVVFARRLKVSAVRLNEIINGKRSVTAETAWLLSRELGTSPQFWMNLQMNFDLAKNRPVKERKVAGRA